MLLDKAGKDSPFPPRHATYWNTSDHYLMGNVTPGDMRAIIQVRRWPEYIHSLTIFTHQLHSLSPAGMAAVSRAILQVRAGRSIFTH
jgi:hypothetical protein